MTNTPCVKDFEAALRADLLPQIRDRDLKSGSNDPSETTLDSYADYSSDHLDWITTQSLTYDNGVRLFVHAGIDPTLPLDDQSPRDLLWIREPFLSSERHFGRLVVHGHTASRIFVPTSSTSTRLLFMVVH
jgi:serine/threonine protein phosphatase 1